ncbi:MULTISPECIES: hypothetical protein [unclassified Myroides]|uniref:hypothetical protein n=1 Tax=unclassified Myroides TaxID=2642485 RepID=UPI003D2F6568
MDDIKSNLQEIKEYTMDRLKMPIFFYYFVILIVWNWDIILFIWKSNYPIEYVIKIIKQNGFEPTRYLYPLIIAAVGNFVFPFIMLVIELSLSKITKKRNDTALEIELKKAEKEYRVLEVKTGIKTISELEDKKNKLEEERDTLNNEVTSLTEEKHQDEIKIVELVSSNDEYKKAHEIITQKVDDLNNFKNSVSGVQNHVTIDQEIQHYTGLLLWALKKGKKLKISIPSILNALTDIYVKQGYNLKASTTSMIDLFVDLDLCKTKTTTNTIASKIENLEFTPKGLKMLFWLKGVDYCHISNDQLNSLYESMKKNELLDLFRVISLSEETHTIIGELKGKIIDLIEFGVLVDEPIHGERSNPDAKAIHTTKLGEELIVYMEFKTYNQTFSK